MTLEEATETSGPMGENIRCPLLQRVDQYGSPDGRSRRNWPGSRWPANMATNPSKKEKKTIIDEEIADVLWVLLCIANQTGVDITDAFRKSMEKKTKRDNKRHINNPKLKDHGRE